MEQNHPPSTDSGSPEKRKSLHQSVSVEAHETWHNTAAELGCSVSGMLEAMVTDDGLEALPRFAEIVEAAKQIDTARGQKGPTPT